MLGRSAGLSPEKLAHLGDDVLPEGLYDDAEAAVIRYTRASTRMDRIDDELYAQLEANFERRQIMELCFEVGLVNLVNRFHATFLTEVDPVTGETVGPACPLEMPDELASAAEAGWERSAGPT